MVVGGAGCQNTELEGGKEGLSLSSTPPSFMEEKSEREQQENLIERQGKGNLPFCCVLFLPVPLLHRVDWMSKAVVAVSSSSHKKKEDRRRIHFFGAGGTVQKKKYVKTFRQDLCYPPVTENFFVFALKYDMT